MSGLEDIMRAHIARMATIQDDAADFARQVAAAHIEVVERRIRPELQVGEQVKEHDDTEAGDEPLSDTAPH